MASDTNSCNNCSMFLNMKKELNQFILDNPCEGYEARSCGNCGNCIKGYSLSVCSKKGKEISDIALKDNRDCMDWVKSK